MIYNLAMYILELGLKLAALFSDKPAKMVKGHREVFDLLKSKIDCNARYIWFHAASLGEFEQGRPLIERMKPNISGIAINFTLEQIEHFPMAFHHLSRFVAEQCCQLYPQL